eukprot:1022647-Heterocapsa_arctica.AAC.1
MDTITLAKDSGERIHLDMSNKSKNGLDKGGYCEPDKTRERPGYQSCNYEKWKYKRRRWHTAPRNRHRTDGIMGCCQTAYSGGKIICHINGQKRHNGMLYRHPKSSYDGIRINE